LKKQSISFYCSTEQHTDYKPARAREQRQGKNKENETRNESIWLLFIEEKINLSNNSYIFAKHKFKI